MNNKKSCLPLWLQMLRHQRPALRLPQPLCQGGPINNDKSITKKRADLILVTDGHCDIQEEYRQRLEDFKDENGLRIFAMTVNGGSIATNVASVCDRVRDIDSAIQSDNHKEIANVLA